MFAPCGAATRALIEAHLSAPLVHGCSQSGRHALVVLRTSHTPPPKTNMSLPHNPNRPGSPREDPARPHVWSHPLFTYSTTVPVDTTITKDFPSPFITEPDFTASPPLYYSHATPVEKCMENHFTKYPHPSVPEIIECPVTHDSTDPETGIRTRTRMVKVRNIAPWLFRRFVSGDYVYLREDSTYDPRTREFLLRSENQTFANLVFAKEATRFRPHPDNSQWTSFVQHGGIRCTSYMGPLKRPLEKIIMDRMTIGGLQASDLLDDVVNAQSPF